MRITKWENEAEVFYDINLGSGRNVTVKDTGTELYIMECSNGRQVYNDTAEYGYADLSKEEERDILERIKTWKKISW